MPNLFIIDSIEARSLIGKRPDFPLFQRRSSWVTAKKFKFFLSVFKGFPLGTVVVNRDVTNEGTTTYFIIDGRQRYEGLEAMLQPEVLYKTALIAVPAMRRADNVDEFVGAFHDYVDDYLFGQDRFDSQGDPSDVQPALESVLEDSIEGSPRLPVSTLAGRFTARLPETRYGHLGLLLELLVFIRSQNGFCRIFGFSQPTQVVDYLVAAGRRRRVDEKSLLRWIDYRASRSGTRSVPTEAEFLERWLEAEHQEASNPRGLELEVHERWPHLSEALRLLAELRDQVLSSRFGYIELSEQATIDDQQKIFDNINTGGDPLSMAEILSARPVWNEPVPLLPGSPLKHQVRELRNFMGLVSTDAKEPRRWDYAATLLDRIDTTLLFGSPDLWTWAKLRGPEFDKKVTYGFRLMAGRYRHGVMRHFVETLPVVADLPWGSGEFELSLDASLRRLGETWFFPRLIAWQSTLADMSDSIALAFALLVEKKWREERAPGRGNAGASRFTAFAIHLFDYLVYEYLSGGWQGGGDRKVGALLEQTDLIWPSNTQWEALVEGLVESSSPGTGRARALLTYLAALLDLRPRPTQLGQVDHIIPKALFEDRPAAVVAGRDRLTNLDLLPKADNNARKALPMHRLSGALQEKMEMYTRISRERFGEFADPTQVQALHEARVSLFTDTFVGLRARLCEDPVHYGGPDTAPLV